MFGGPIFVLACVSEIGHHSGNAAGRTSFESIDDNQKLHQVIVGGVGGRLNQENIISSDAFLYFDKNFLIGKTSNDGL